MRSTSGTFSDPSKQVKESGDVKAASYQKKLQASYFKPYHKHASLGTACAVAIFEEGRMTVWTSSQGVYPLRSALGSMLDMKEEEIHVISSPGAGCFGHTTSDDAAADACLMARAVPGKHVMVQWSREDDFAWEPYASAMSIDLEAGLDAGGKISYLKTNVWTDTHSTRPNRDAGTLLAARYLANPFKMKGRGYLNGGHRNADPYYAIPNFQINAHFFDGPLRVSSLRSLAAYGNIFALESFMDELAAKANRDPIEFRLGHMEDIRARAVLEKVREMTKEAKVSEGEGIGYAFCRYKNNSTYCAMAAKIQVELDSIKLLSVWTAIDVGEVINPDGLRQQMEGGIIQAASWTLKEAVRFDEQGINSLTWASYPTLKASECPKIEVAIIDRPEEPAMGAGEGSVPPVGAAIANAVFQACGKRLYSLPLQLKARLSYISQPVLTGS